MAFLTRIRNRTGEVEANLPWLLDQETPPLVDVFICTYNEEEAILERTMIGALALNYPRFRVWMLDDGRRPWLAELCKKGGCGYLTPKRQQARQGRQYQQRARSCRRPRSAAGFHRDPRRRFRSDAGFPDPRPDVVQRRGRRRRPDAAEFRQPRPDAIQPVALGGLARRATLFLRRHHGFERCMGRGVLLRHVLDHSLCSAEGDGRISHRFRHRGLSADVAAAPDRLSHRLSQRASLVRTLRRRA